MGTVYMYISTVHVYVLSTVPMCNHSVITYRGTANNCVPAFSCVLHFSLLCLHKVGACAYMYIEVTHFVIVIIAY